MKNVSTKSGFTLIELSISSLIIALISLVLIFVFRSNLTTWKWGQKHMEFNQQVQLVMKQIFTDLKNINPIIKADSDGNLHFQGEKIGDFFPNLIKITNTDKKEENGGEELDFSLATVAEPDKIKYIRYFLQKDKLIRKITDYNGNQKEKVIAEKVSDLHFTLNPNDIREICVQLIMGSKKNPELKETMDFAVRLDTDLVCVKMINDTSK